MLDCSSLEAVQEKMAASAARAGRDLSEIRLLAVSKRKPVSAIETLFRCGQRLFGENYVQEAMEKLDHLSGEVRRSSSWHFIGHLQRNKVKYVIRYFDLIQTVDSVRLGREISRRAEAAGRVMPVFIQVNIGQDPAKSGVLPDELPGLLEGLLDLPGLKVSGLMTIPPFSSNLQETRRYFREMRRLKEDMDPAGKVLKELSMGMSGDFHVAIEEGATIVRIGTALFGPRD